MYWFTETVSLCSPKWTQICSSPASSSCMLKLEMCAITFLLPTLLLSSSIPSYLRLNPYSTIYYFSVLHKISTSFPPLYFVNLGWLKLVPSQFSAYSLLVLIQLNVARESLCWVTTLSSNPRPELSSDSLLMPNKYTLLYLLSLSYMTTLFFKTLPFLLLFSFSCVEPISCFTETHRTIQTSTSS